MGVYAKDVAEFAGTPSDSDAPLGERLRAVAGELEVDSVAEVRDVRERL